ncbi:MAG: isoprenylcysteine carboxylmethyltransferase family protein [Lachnospiraceae bacterium]|nr:isoprenylcysteine carboxylmethyltransferase family protein [Lachnospiraceae bacterium]
MKDKSHLPMYGIGPLYVWSIIMMTVAGIVLSRKEIVHIGNLARLKTPFMVAGWLLIVWGVILWVAAVVGAHIDTHILQNQLVTTGIYGYVRNPIYSAAMFACTGALLIANDVWLLILPFLFWGYMTVLLKSTEEKWLKERYGRAYSEYKMKVNRCIPWFKKSILREMIVLPDVEDMSERELLMELVREKRKREQLDRAKLLVNLLIVAAVVVLACIYVPRVVHFFRELRAALDQVNQAIDTVKQTVDNIKNTGVDTLTELGDKLSSFTEGWNWFGR